LIRRSAGFRDHTECRCGSFEQAVYTMFITPKAISYNLLSKVFLP
jgi:hypothetical protein